MTHDVTKQSCSELHLTNHPRLNLVFSRRATITFHHKPTLQPQSESIHEIFRLPTSICPPKVFIWHNPTPSITKTKNKHSHPKCQPQIHKKTRLTLLKHSTSNTSPFHIPRGTKWKSRIIQGNTYLISRCLNMDGTSGTPYEIGYREEWRRNASIWWGMGRLLWGGMYSFCLVRSARSAVRWADVAIGR